LPFHVIRLKTSRLQSRPSHHKIAALNVKPLFCHVGGKEHWQHVPGLEAGDDAPLLPAVHAPGVLQRVDLRVLCGRPNVRLDVAGPLRTTKKGFAKVRDLNNLKCA
jgi:hypothetical protein